MFLVGNELIENIIKDEIKYEKQSKVVKLKLVSEFKENKDDDAANTEINIVNLLFLKFIFISKIKLIKYPQIQKIEQRIRDVIR